MTNEYENTAGVVRAETEVIDGITYEVVYLTGDNNANKAKIGACNQNTAGNYRYVMTADWDLAAASGQASMFGNSLIFDFNGYYVKCATGRFMRLGGAPTVEITDTSPLGGGGVGTLVIDNRVKNLTCSGNLCPCYIEIEGDCKVVVRGGNQLSFACWGEMDMSRITFDLPAYMRVDYEDQHNKAIKSLADYFTVSTTDLVSGTYNYAYGLAWEINAAELSSLEVPDDKTYYLWGRNKNGWYQYLDLRYVGGAWQNAA